MARRSGAEWRGGQCIFSQGWRGVARRSLVPPGGRGDQNPAHPPPPIHLFGQLPHLRGGVGGGISGATPKNTLDGRPPPLEVGGDKIRRHPTPKYTFLNDPPTRGKGRQNSGASAHTKYIFWTTPHPCGNRRSPRHSAPLRATLLFPLGGQDTGAVIRINFGLRGAVVARSCPVPSGGVGDKNPAHPPQVDIFG